MYSRDIFVSRWGVYLVLTNYFHTVKEILIYHVSRRLLIRQKAKYSEVIP